MTSEELRLDDEDVYRDYELENPSETEMEELHPDLGNVVFSDSEREMDYSEISEAEEAADYGSRNESMADENMNEDNPAVKQKTIQNKGKVSEVGGLEDQNLQRNYATRREYEVYNFQERRHIKNRWTHARKLSQLYLIHTVTQIQQMRTNVWKMKNMEYYNSTKSVILLIFLLTFEFQRKIFKSLERGCKKTRQNDWMSLISPELFSRIATMAL